MDSSEKEDPCLQLFVPYKLQKAPPPQEVPPREVDGMTHQWVPASLSGQEKRHEGHAWLQQQGLPLIQSDPVTATAGCLACQQRRPTSSLTSGRPAASRRQPNDLGGQSDLSYSI